MSQKRLVESEQTQASLLNLKAELWQKEKDGLLTPQERMLAFKINSCLYSSYPTSKSGEK